MIFAFSTRKYETSENVICCCTFLSVLRKLNVTLYRHYEKMSISVRKIPPIGCCVDIEHAALFVLSSCLGCVNTVRKRYFVPGLNFFRKTLVNPPSSYLSLLNSVSVPNSALLLKLFNPNQCLHYVFIVPKKGKTRCSHLFFSQH